MSPLPFDTAAARKFAALAGERNVGDLVRLLQRACDALDSAPTGLDAHPLAGVMREVVGLDVSLLATITEQGLYDALERFSRDFFHANAKGQRRVLAEVAARARGEEPGR